MKKKLALALSLALGMASAWAAAEIQPAYLYKEVAPEAYIRLPQQWTLLFADGARDQNALSAYWPKIQEKLALLPDLAQNLDDKEKAFINHNLRHNAGALEFAFYPGRGGIMTVAGSMQLDYRDDRILQEFVATLASSNGWQHEGDGREGRLRSEKDKPFDAAYRFDPQNGRLRWLVGQQLADNVDWSAFVGREASPSLVAAAERIDPQGRGMVFWIRNNPLILAGMSGEDGQPWVKALQLLKLKSVALGYGVADDGRPALQLNAEITPGGLRDFFPTAPAAKDLAVYGTVHTAFAFTLPDAAGLQKLLRIIEQGSGERNLYQDWQALLQTEWGIDLALLADALGTQWSVIDDAYGRVVAMPRNDGHWNAAITMLQAGGWLKTEDIGDTGMTHARLSLQPFFEKDPQLAEKMANDPLLALFASVPTHFYWQEEGDYRVFASLPQILMDRARSKRGGRLGDYLAAGGVQDMENNTFAVMTVDALARKYYYSRLATLQYFADIADMPLNLASLPSAQMLNLPETGHIGMAVGGDSENMRVRISFAHSYLDMMQAGGAGMLGGAAVAGMLAAIALPAYQDYVERAKAQRVYDLSQAEITEIQEIIAQIFSETAPLREKLDNAEEVNDEDIAAYSQQNTLIEDIWLGKEEMWLEETESNQESSDHLKTLEIYFNGNAPSYLQESKLEIRPVKEGDTVKWYCDMYHFSDAGNEEAVLPPICSPY